jgi:hydroxymethylpyrimidine pyrophosphatase-like HAD family hydrolase
MPLYVGRVIVAIPEDQKEKVLDAIHELGLELQMIFNKGSLMVLPSGINKASGLKACLKKIDLSPRKL